MKIRRGVVTMSNEFYLYNWEDFVLALNDFKLTHIEYRHWEADTWYFYGTSECFDVNIEGEVIPKYEIIFTRDEDEELTYKFRKYEN